MDSLFPLGSSSFILLQSTGLGGLGIIWGANCFVFEDFQLRKIGIPPEEIQPRYTSAALEVGVSEKTDDCTAPTIADTDSSVIHDALPIELWLNRNERRQLIFLVKLGCIQLGISKPTHGASIHYAGTPFSKLRGTEDSYVADSSSWCFLPVKRLTLTLMANARRVAAQAIRDLEQSPAASAEANR
jgi:hypothetical protein